MHLLNSWNDRSANKRALKAARGKSRAPRGYKPDTETREYVTKASNMPHMDEPTSNLDYKAEFGHSEFDNSKGIKGRKTAFSKAALLAEHGQGRSYEGTPAEIKGDFRSSSTTDQSYGGKVPTPPTNKEGLTLITGKKK